MKYTNYLSALVITSMLLSGCGDSEEAASNSTTTHIEGKTTLSKGYVCLDTNENELCDVGEVNATTGVKGEYVLDVSQDVKDGTALIAKDGSNIVLDLQNNRNRLTFKASYQKSEETHNITTMTTLVFETMKNDKSYEDAKKYLSDKYGIAVEDIVKDPIGLAKTDGKLLQIIHASEEKTTQDAINNANRSKKRGFFDFTSGSSSSGGSSSSEATTVTEDTVDSATEDGSYLDFDVDAYLDEISAFFDSIVAYFDNLFGDTLDVAITGERNILNGVWLLENKGTGDSSCVEIDALDNVTIHTTDSTDELSMSYDDSTSKLDLLYGYSTVETFTLYNFTQDSYEADYSDGKVYATRVSALEFCMSAL